MTLGILTALWQRPRISEVVLHHYVDPGYLPEVDMVRVAVRSPEDPNPAGDVAGWRYVEAPNYPVSDKWNAAMAAMQADAVMIVGSDNLISSRYVLDAMEAVNGGAELVMLEGLFVWCSETRRAIRTNLGRMGAGRMLSKGLIERVGGRLWSHGLNARLDRGMDQMLSVRPRPRTVKLRDKDGRACLEIKSETNIWSFDALASSPKARPIDGSQVFRDYFPKAAQMLGVEMAQKKPKFIGGGIYELPNGERIRGKDAAYAAMDEQKDEEVTLTATANIPAHRSPTGVRIPRGTKFKANGVQARQLRGWVK